MKTVSKKWTHLGLSAALAGSALLASCGQEAPKKEPTPEPTASATTAAPDDVETPVVVPGEGGEGEGGVAIDRAGTDPVVFRSALAITEAHILAAHDAYMKDQKDAAGEMFAHPVSEVLSDVEPYLKQQGVEDFTDLLINASTAVYDGASKEDITSRTDDIITALRDAATKAPDDGSSEARIAAGVAADQLDRAAVMYELAGKTDDYEPYLDGYGFYKAAMNAYEMGIDGIKAEYPDAATAIEKSLELMSKAYADVLRPETLDQNPAALTASASAVILALGE